jgi:hypothetical protein
MSSTATTFNPNRIEALLPLMRGWLVGVASLVLALVERCGGRHRRLLRPFLLRLERGLANWLFLSACQRLPLPSLPRATARPRFAPPGFRRVRAGRMGLRRFVRIRAHAAFAARLCHVIETASNPERTIARLVLRLSKSAAGARLVAIAPPEFTLRCDAPAPQRVSADSS